jgi:uncharacterized hydantoinase/oxoprolinase family protein
MLFWICLGIIILLACMKESFKDTRNKEKIATAGLAKAEYSDVATLAGGNHPLLNSHSGKLILAVKKDSFVIADMDSRTIVAVPIKNVKAETVTVSNATAGNILLFGALAFGAKKSFLQIEIHDESTKETYKSLFTDTDIGPDCINKARYDYLVQENSAQAVQL